MGMRMKSGARWRGQVDRWPVSVELRVGFFAFAVPVLLTVFAAFSVRSTGARGWTLWAGFVPPVLIAWTGGCFTSRALHRRLRQAAQQQRVIGSGR